jgi:hypothetical protein
MGELVSDNNSLRASNMRLLRQVDALSAEKRESRVAAVTLQLTIARLRENDDTLTAANQHLRAAVDVLTQAQDDHAAERNGPDPVQPAASRASGGVNSRPGNTERVFAGSLESKSNLARWKEYAKSALMPRLPPPQMRATIAALYADLCDHKAALQANLCNMTHRDLTAVIPEEYLSCKIRAGQQELADAIQDHWGVTRSLGIKFKNALSRAKWESLRNEVSAEWKDGEWVPMEHNGVSFPTLAKRHDLEKAVRAIKKETGLTSFAEGLGVQVDIRKLAIVNMLESVKNGLFYVDHESATVKQRNGGGGEGVDPELMNVMDSASHHRGMKVTSTGFNYPHGTHHPMAPVNQHEHAHTEAGDGNDDMAMLGKPVLDGEHIHTHTHTHTH